MHALVAPLVYHIIISAEYIVDPKPIPNHWLFGIVTLNKACVELMVDTNNVIVPLLKLYPLL